ncbi:MAG: hypothetical protein HY264_05385 [Chloroflexi bacterium]|nr:hypothetical protein [Chloroflexota bacterium]
MPQSTRARRFSLPDMADGRVDEAISSFLSGPQHRRGRREPVAAPGAGGPATGAFSALETRIAWEEALRRESARSARYRRPAAVMVISAIPTARTPEARAWLGRIAGAMAHAVHRGLRDTDLVTRTGDARFNVLLPETTEREVRHVADRIVLDCQVWLKAVGAPVAIRAFSAAIATDSSLDMALERVLAAAGTVAEG